MKKPALFVDHFFAGLTRRQMLALILLVVVMFGAIDYLTGFEITFSYFYLFPIALATWYLGTGDGYVLTVCSVAIWLVSNWLAGETYSSGAIFYWNVAVRMIFFILISQVFSYLKIALELATKLSRTDALTGTPNTREFYRLAELELLRAARYHHPITIAYLDLDDFKKVNDHFGHNTGDELLCSVANSIRNILRRTDIFARLGGDEFALLLPETDQHAAECVVRKIQTHLQVILQGKKFQITFSLGAICFTAPPASIDDMLSQADALMYTVKTQGKNNFIVTSRN